VFNVILTFHILLALCLVFLVLIQQGKGSEVGAAFGSGSSGSMFGARGANSFLYKVTATIAIFFFLTSLTLAYLATSNTAGTIEQSESVMQDVVEIETEDLPNTSTEEDINIPKIDEIPNSDN
jgi:preprotein translocase subunit SecG